MERIVNIELSTKEAETLSDYIGLLRPSDLREYGVDVEVMKTVFEKLKRSRQAS